MKTGAIESPSRLFLSGSALKLARIPAHLRAAARTADLRFMATPLAVTCASEVLRVPEGELPEWLRKSDTRHLVLVDVPEPALNRLPRALHLTRADDRLWLTRDAAAVRRLVLGFARRQPVLGIVDAFVLGGELNVLTGDMEQRTFPIRRIPELVPLSARQRGDFRIDQDGSYLHWPSHDVHTGVSQLLQQFDPMFMVDVEIERNERDQTGAALRAMREQRGLRQTDIPGMSERQVHRIETGVSRLRWPSVQKFAAAFGIEPKPFLDELAGHVETLRNRPRPVSRKRPANRGRGGPRAREIGAGK